MTARLRTLGLLWLFVSAALLSTGCLWGVVRDARTGAPIAGASVSFRDSRALTATAVTNSDGWFAFDAAQGVTPSPGPVDFTVTATGYSTLNTQRHVLYDDGAGGWEVQSFSLAVTDISIPGPPPGG